MSKLRTIVIGVGHLGKEHARILSDMPQVELVGVIDPREQQAEQVAARCGTAAFTDHRPLLDGVDAAVIASPTISHHSIALDCLRAGISLLVEKPLAITIDQANELVLLANEKQCLLQVGHIERFNPAFEELRRRSLQPKLIRAHRLSPYTGRSTDIGVVHDLMIHDLDLILTLVRSPIRSVSALGACFYGGHEDMVHAHLTFENGCVADLTANRAHHQAERKMEIWGPEGFVEIDFQRKSLRLAQPEETPRGLQPGSDRFRREELLCDSPGPDQLTCELLSFIESLRLRQAPRVTGEQGRNALVLASHVLNSVKMHRWNGLAEGPVGPQQLPQPLGPLFIPRSRSAA